MYNAKTPKHTSKLDVDRGGMFSLYYHKLFEYPLTKNELIRWKASNIPGSFQSNEHTVKLINGYYLLDSMKNSIIKRVMRTKISERKLRIAVRASNILSKIPSIKMVGLTGSLAMMNADENSDIDLMIIVQKDTLWTTRLLVLLNLILFGFKIRRAGEKEEKDMICTNIYLDESDLIWTKRNFFTAHEIAQVVPLANKENVYEKFILNNKWITRYWPNSVEIKKYRNGKKNVKFIGKLQGFFNPICFFLQKLYMRKRITCEYVSMTKALFHPVDWGEIVNSRLNL